MSLNDSSASAAKHIIQFPELGWGSTFPKKLLTARADISGLKARKIKGALFATLYLCMTHQKTVLVADDDAAITESVTFMLEEAGYAVMTADTEEGIFKAIQTPVDVLLLDIRMSGIDGREICRLLKKNPKTHDIPTIMVSANRDTAHIARDCGADDYLAKPFEMEELLEKIKKYTP